MDNKIYTIKIKNETLQYGYGILTKNPTKVNNADLKCYKNLVWILYDGWWYITKFSALKDFENHLKKTPIYSKKQAFEFICNLVY